MRITIVQIKQLNICIDISLNWLVNNTLQKLVSKFKDEELAEGII